MSKSVLILFFLLCIGGGGLWFAYDQAAHRPVVAKDYVLEVNKGDSFADISTKLINAGIAVKPFWFKVIAYRDKVQNKLKAGEYELPAGATMPQIIALLAEGKAKRYAVTFPEGWSFEEILKQLAITPSLTQTLQGKSLVQIAAELGVSGNNPEGWLFPDTYFFEKSASDLSILKRAHKQMQSVLESEWQQKSEGLPYKTPYEALIMASIIEKETGAKSERPRIASVFVNRLRKGMLLQTDPTVIYGIGKKYDGNIRAGDLQRPTPYNTYVINGLPPTPIAMPGRAAINAALNPEKEEHLYFVAKGDGSHHFSASLSEHNRAVNQFQKKIHVR
jgi:UPF0755 protein